MGGELILAGQQRFLPVLSVTEAVQRRHVIVQFVKEVMTPDVDFGRIPGTEKLTLLKPGAEKLCTLFGLSPRFQIIHCVEDWMGEQHGGEPFFYYLYRCQLWREDHLIAEGDGSCNSFEQKYRYREAQRLCPACGKPAIIKGKAEFGGGWVCFAKRGGCGAKYPDGDETIESQQVGRILNPHVADLVNTLQKIGQKRALVAATLLAVNASEFFTQDVEDRVVEAEFAPDPVVASPLPPEDRPEGEEESRSVPEPARPQTAAMARAAFVAKAMRQFGFQDRAALARLAVALLGGKPERWTARTWQEACEKPLEAWQEALHALNSAGPAGISAPAGSGPDTSPPPAPGA